MPTIFETVAKGDSNPGSLDCESGILPLSYRPPSLAVAGEHGKRHTVRAHLSEAVCNWLNPLSLGTMSASGYIENLA